MEADSSTAVPFGAALQVWYDDKTLSFDFQRARRIGPSSCAAFIDCPSSQEYGKQHHNILLERGCLLCDKFSSQCSQYEKQYSVSSDKSLPVKEILQECSILFLPCSITNGLSTGVNAEKSFAQVTPSPQRSWLLLCKLLARRQLHKCQCGSRIDCQDARINLQRLVPN